MQIVDLLGNTILKAILFSIIAFTWWIIYGKKECGFLKWLGIRKPVVENKTRYTITFVFTAILLSISSFSIVPIFINKSTMSNVQFSVPQLSLQGGTTLIPVLIYAFLQGSILEELFFRGFLTKRFINKFGFKVGNIIQSLLYGLLRGRVFISLVGLPVAIVIILLTCIAGWLMGLINEKQSDGSIVSSWLINGCATILASIVVMFNIL